MKTQYNINFYTQIISNNYNGFVSLAFSHLLTTESGYFSSFMILGYANSTNYTFNIINEIKNKQVPIDKLCFYLNETFSIENNLLEFSFYGTQIIDYSDGMQLKQGNDTIQKNNSYILLKDRCITISFPEENGINKANSYRIELAYVVKETANGGLTSYTQKIYTGKYSNFSFVISNDVFCLNDSCVICNESLLCLFCKDYMNFNEFKKKCYPGGEETTHLITEKETEISTVIPTEKITEEITEKITDKINNVNIPSTINDIIINMTYPITEYFTNNCSIDDLISNKCQIEIVGDQITNIYNQLKEQIKSNKRMIISTEKVTFQISTLEEQRSNNDPNISSIELGKCEERIKESRNLTEKDELIMYKIDIKSEDLSTTYVQYEVYDPKTYDPINLDICEDIFINIYIPVSLKQSTESLFNSMLNSGYDLFNLNDSFYNDICSTYTTEDGTDLTLLDRKKIIYNNNANITMCQQGCSLISYISNLKKANCDCQIQTGETKTNVEDIEFNKKELASNFYKTLTNSNFRVLKCYKLVFSKKGQKNNIGSYTMSVITFIFIILLLVLLFKGKDKIIIYIQSLLNQKEFILNENESKIKEKDNIIITDKIKSNNINKNKSKKNKINDKKESNKKKYNQDKIPKRENVNKKRNKRKNMNKNFPPRKAKKNKGMQTSLLSSNKSLSKQILNLNQINIVLNNENEKKKKKDSTKNNKRNKMDKYNNSNIEAIKYDYINNKNKLNDEELNELYYELAIELDKRTYFQYYVCLLKKKHLILFAFCPSDDYNFPAVKISLLLLSFSLYFTINGFFFTDETMNKINEDKGAFNLLYQIPQILYSTIICAVINLIIKRLSLTEKQILLIKKEKNYEDAKKKSRQIKSSLKVKLIIFFVISFLLMLFFWYFISCFCAVYKNTQIILIKDTLISFGLSMLYPFGLNLLPGMFRIPALKAKNKNMKCIYQFSGFVALV